MTDQRERGDKEEKQTSLLDATKAKLERAIRSPLLPNIIPITLSPLITRIMPLEPEEFIAEGMSLYGGRITRENESTVRESANSSTAAYTDHYSADGKPAIIIKQTYLDSNPHVGETIASLLAEELGHGFSSTREVPLAALKDQPSYLMPGKTKEETAAAVNDALRERGDLDSPATTDDIVIKIRGFKSVFIDRRTGFYVIFGGSTILEEARSSFIQAVLDIIIAGQEGAQFASPENQFTKGSQSLQFRTWYDFRFQRARQFLDTYLSDTKNLRQGLEKLLKSLYRQNADQFVLSLPPAHQQSFNQAVMATLKEQERRMKLKR